MDFKEKLTALAEREKKDSQIDKMLEMMQAQGEQQSKLIDYITKG